MWLESKQSQQQKGATSSYQVFGSISQNKDFLLQQRTRDGPMIQGGMWCPKCTTDLLSISHNLLIQTRTVKMLPRWLQHVDNITTNLVHFGLGKNMPTFYGTGSMSTRICVYFSLSSMPYMALIGNIMLKMDHIPNAKDLEHNHLGTSSSYVCQ